MTKRIVMLTIGSRGDVQPFVALGVGLRQAGYNVTIGTHDVFEDFVISYGLDFAPIAGNPRHLLERLASDKAGANTLTFVRQINDWVNDTLDDLLRDTTFACTHADLILYSFLCPMGPSIAEKLGIPAVSAYLYPVGVPTRDYPGVTFSEVSWLPKPLNRLTHQIERSLIGVTRRQAINHWRQEDLGLAPYPTLQVYPYAYLDDEPIHMLYGYSPEVIPPPADYPEHVHVTGYWFLDANSNWTPPPALEAFLNAGEPPVYIGFGSLIDSKTEHLVQMLIAAGRAAGQRILLLSGWAGFQKMTLSDDVFVIPSAPHDWLFPRMAAVVHHGGAGTTAAALRAGVPTVVVPFFGDQPFWGHKVFETGVGPEPIPADQLNAMLLSEAIYQAVNDPTMRERAAQVGATIRAEDGIGSAIRILESLL